MNSMSQSKYQFILLIPLTILYVLYSISNYRTKELSSYQHHQRIDGSSAGRKSEATRTEWIISLKNTDKRLNSTSVFSDQTGLGNGFTTGVPSSPRNPTDSLSTINDNDNGNDNDGSVQRKTCSITKHTLPPYSQHPDLQYYPHHHANISANHNNSTGTNDGHIRVLFLLGYPNTGTSAVHFLLATSSNVTTLHPNSNLMNSKKEGWSVVNLKYKHTRKERWDGNLSFVDWDDLALRYGDYWGVGNRGNGRKKTVRKGRRRNKKRNNIFLENSPPEIQAPEKIMKTFQPLYTSVKFLLLVRGDCTYRREHNYPSNVRAKGYANVLRRYPRDTFVLRFEDLCLRWDDVYEDLVRWEPMLVDVNIRKVPKNKNRGSVRAYCKKVLEEWENVNEEVGAKVYTGNHPLKEWGYIR